MALFKAFVQLDQDGSGEISVDEFHTHWHIKPTKFSTRVFDAVDLDRSQSLNFREFIVGLWNFLRLDTAALVNFAFSLIDIDASGDLDKAECKALVRMLYNTEDVTPKLAKVIGKMDTNGDDSITAKEFSDFCKRSPALIRPAVALQSKVRQKLAIQGIRIGPVQTLDLLHHRKTEEVDVAALLRDDGGDEEEARRRAASEVGALAFGGAAGRRRGRPEDDAGSKKKIKGNEFEEALEDLHGLTQTFDGNEENFPVLSAALDTLIEMARLTKERDHTVCDARYTKYRAKAGRRARKDTRLYLEEPDGMKYLSRRVKRAAGKQSESSLRQQLEKEAVEDAQMKVNRHFDKEREALQRRHEQIDNVIIDESHFVAENTWELRYDGSSGECYYHCIATGVSCWEKPHGHENIGLKRVEAWAGAGASPGGIARPKEIFVSPSWTLTMFLGAGLEAFGNASTETTEEFMKIWSFEHEIMPPVDETEEPEEGAVVKSFHAGERVKVKTDAEFQDLVLHWHGKEAIRLWISRGGE